MRKCHEGNHSLVIILSTGSDQDLTVVRWCQFCGAIVVDKDYDGRTNAGAILPMRWPEIAIKWEEPIP